MSWLLNNVIEAAVKLKDTVVEATQEFEREQKKFVDTKPAHEREHSRVGTETVPPWEGLHNADELRTQIVALSADKRNFLIDPPNGTEFAFDMAVMFPIAKTIMAEDSRLSEMRFQLVPKQTTEPTFWRNYFYRVSLIKQSAQLSMQLLPPAASVPGTTTATAAAVAKPQQLQTRTDEQDDQQRLPTVTGEQPPAAAKSSTQTSVHEEPEFISDSVMHTQPTSTPSARSDSMLDDYENLEITSPASPSGGGAGAAALLSSDDDDQFDLEKELENELRGYEASSTGTSAFDDEVLL